MSLELATHPDWADRIITEHGDVIRRFDPAEQQAMHPHPDTWRRHNPDDPDVEWALNAFPDGIHRHDLTRLARNLSTPQKRRRLLAAALMWGAGDRNRYYRRHHQALNHPDLDAILRDTTEQIRDGDLDAAWQRATDFHGHGMRHPFFTKWLWAIGTPTNHTVRPLIFDGNVEDGLKKQSWLWRKHKINDRQRWLDYCADAAAIAQELNITSESVEYWLFKGAPVR